MEAHRGRARPLERWMGKTTRLSPLPHYLPLSLIPTTALTSSFPLHIVLFHFHHYFEPADATGLSRMARQHIHLALSTLPSQSATQPEGKVISGIRATSKYLLYLDVPMLLERTSSSLLSSSSFHSRVSLTLSSLLLSFAPLLSLTHLFLQPTRSFVFTDNVPLFLSTNDVLLSPGDPNASSPGRIERAFFLRLVERKTGRVVWTRGDEGDGVKEGELPSLDLRELKIE